MLHHRYQTDNRFEYYRQTFVTRETFYQLSLHHNLIHIQTMYSDMSITLAYKRWLFPNVFLSKGRQRKEKLPTKNIRTLIGAGSAKFVEMAYV